MATRRGLKINGLKWEVEVILGGPLKNRIQLKAEHYGTVVYGAIYAVDLRYSESEAIEACCRIIGDLEGKLKQELMSEAVRAFAA